VSPQLDSVSCVLYFVYVLHDAGPGRYRMTFSEKGAWIMVSSTALVATAYAASVQVAGGWDVGSAAWLFAAMIALVMVSAAGHAMAAASNPSQADRVDERDHAIALRAQQVGGWVMSAGAVGIAGYAMVLGQWRLAHLLLFALAAATIAEPLTAIVLYRRDA